MTTDTTSLFIVENILSLYLNLVTYNRLRCINSWPRMDPVKILRLLLLTLLSGIFSLSLAANTTHFTFTSQTGNSATIGVPLDANPNVDGEPLAPGDEIGVFTPDGLCVGGVVWNGETNVGITVWGNNSMTEEIDGMRAGEEIQYRIWKHETDTEIKVVEVEYLLGDGIYQPQGIYRVESLHAYKPPGESEGIHPEDNATGVSLEVEFMWDEVSGADSYALQLSTVSNFSTFIVNQENIGDTHYTVSGLQYNSRYFWRVRSTGYGGDSEWSPVYSFTTLEQLDTLTIPLSSNWSLISSNIYPVDPEVRTIFSNIDNNSIFVKDRWGRVYWPATEIYDIDAWDITETYWVYIDSPDTVRFTGARVFPQDVQFEFQRGWNYPAFLYGDSQPVELIFTPIRDKLELIKTHTGLIYWPDFNINTIGEIHPGQGFQLYMNEHVQFTYPEIDDAIAKHKSASNNDVTAHTINNNRFRPKHTNTGESAVLLVETAFARNDDEIAVWDSLGNLVGAGVIHNQRAAVTVWGDNVRTEGIKDGALDNEPLSVSLWSVGENVEYSLMVDSIKDVIADSVRTGDLRYSTDGIYIVQTEKEEQQEPDLPTNYTLFQNYPNPFNPTTTIRFSIPQDSHVRLTVYNLLGQEVKELVDSDRVAGIHQVQFDASNLPSGV